MARTMPQRMLRWFLKEPEIKYTIPQRVLRWSFRKQLKWYQRRYFPKPPPPPPPPTPEQTAQAIAYLQMAWQRTRDYWDKDKYKGETKYHEFQRQLGILGQASQALEASAKLDPTVMTTVQQDDETRELTHDYLAVEIIYLEALTHFYIGKNYKADGDATKYQMPSLETMSNKRDLRAFTREAEASANTQYGFAFEAFNASIAACNKGLTFSPDNFLFLSTLADVYLEWPNHNEASKYINRILELNPTNQTALAMKLKL